MATDDMRCKAHVLTHRECGERQQHESLVLVIILRVDAVTPVKRRATQQVNRQIAAGQHRAIDGEPHLARTEAYCHVGQPGHRRYREP